MNLFRLTAVSLAAFLSVFNPAAAQWQTPAHSVPVGRGVGIIGFGSVPPGTAGLPLTSGGPSADPVFSGIDASAIISGNLAISRFNSGTNANASTVWKGSGVWAASRTVLTGNATFFVDVVHGVNQAGCGLANMASACQTVQFLIGILQSNYDFGGFAVVIQLANSTSPAYAGFTVSGPWTGGNNVTVQGNTGAPTSVVIDGGGAATCVASTEGATFIIQGVQIQNCGNLLESFIGGSQLYFQQIAFAAPSSGGISVTCTRQSYCEVIGGGNTISAIGSSFLQSTHQGNFRAAEGNTGATPFTLTANVTATNGQFSFSSSQGDITFTGYTSSGFNLNGFTATGVRWGADSNGLFQVLNASTGKSLTPTFFPGSVAGSCLGDCSIDQGAHNGATVSACGTGPATGGNDFYGTTTEGSSATGCVITFSSAFSQAPFCFLTWVTPPPSSVTIAATSTGFSVTHSSSSNSIFNYLCKGY